MTDEAAFENQNRERIHSVESSFGPSGRPLYQPGRILMGEGRLKKQGRRKAETKSFFLFNDVLVYGSIVLNGRWHKNQKIISLEHIIQEDMDNSWEPRNRWLIRTPHKSFFVSAASYEEKQAWMEHIEECRASLLQDGSRQPGSNFAVAWIPDGASYKCMRCLNNFSVTRRRHHCRRCGFLVCNSCSKQREVIGHIHPTKRLRVCSLCHIRKEEDASRLRVDRNGSLEDDDWIPSNDEEEEEETMQKEASSSWSDFRSDTCGQMTSLVDPEPMPPRPQAFTM